jgi:hypothetical protein
MATPTAKVSMIDAVVHCVGRYGSGTEGCNNTDDHQLPISNIPFSSPSGYPDPQNVSIIDLVERNGKQTAQVEDRCRFHD